MLRCDAHLRAALRRTWQAGACMQVAWSPLSHGMFLSAQAGRGVHLAHYSGIACSFETTMDPSSGQQVTQRVSRPLPRAPSWLRRRAVARFGFGGKLAVARPPIGRDSLRAVSVRTLTLEPELKAHSEAFEEAMGGDLRSYCQQKAAMEADPEKEYWTFIEVRRAHALVLARPCSSARVLARTDVCAPV
jgi:hypothetical protein